MLLLLAVSATSAVGQSGVYLRLGDIKGETLSGAYAGWIQLQSFETDWSRSDVKMTGSTRRKPEVIVGDIIVTKALDASTPKLMKYAATGGVIPAGAIVIVRNGKPFVRYDLRNVMVDAYSVAAGALDTIEEVALQFDEILMTYLPESDSPYTGSFQWNLLQ